MMASQVAVSPMIGRPEDMTMNRPHRKSLIDEAIEDGAVDPTLQPFILINPFAKATVEPMHDVESPMEEVPAFHEEMPNSNRKLSREWDASKVPPSRFQRRRGSIYATPSSRDSQKGRERDQAYYDKLREKGWAVGRKNSV